MINLLSCGFFSCPKDSDRGNQDSYILPTPTGKGFYLQLLMASVHTRVQKR